MKKIAQITYALSPALLVALTAQAKESKEQKNKNTSKPNVILIYADDLGYGDLECYGAKNIQTPNVNKLAKNGIRFTNAHATASTSTPSRYSLLTGEYAWRRKDTDVAPGNAGMIIRPEQFTMADMFKSAGYTTCAIGKWHLGLGDKTGQQDWNAPLPSALGDIGFDYHYIMAATADRVPCVFIENGKVANYDENAPIEVNYYRNFEGEPTGKDNPELLYNQKSSHGHDMSIVNGIGRIGYMKGGGKALWKDENIADSITTHAIKFISENREKPFFMYFATNDVHVPRFPHERCSDNGPVVDDGYQDRAEELLNGHQPAGPFRGNKYSSFEGGTAIPVIVSWKNKVAKNQESDVLLSQIDWLASFAHLVGARLPKGSAFDSENHLSNLLGEKTNAREWVLEQSNTRVLSVRTQKWKYIEPSDGPKMIQWGPKIETGNSAQPQLFDMQASNFEENAVRNKKECKNK